MSFGAYTYVLEVNKCNGHIFKSTSLTAMLKSKMAAMEPLFLFIYHINQTPKLFTVGWKFMQ